MSEPKLDTGTPTDAASIRGHDSITSTDDNLNQNEKPPPKNATSPDPENPLSLHQTTSTTYLAPSLSPLRETLFLIPLFLAQLTTQAGACQALPLLTTLTTHYTLSAPSVPWFLAAYSLTVGTFILISGPLGDLFGHKNLLILGYLWFSLWSLACGFSAYVDTNVVLFDVSRAMQGIGPSVLLPNALAILGRTYPPGGRQRS